MEMSTNDLFIKDAFLVFRALCKLTMKPLNAERCVRLILVISSSPQGHTVNGTLSRMRCGPSCSPSILCSLS